MERDLLAYEKKLYKDNITLIAGVDEVGRGPLVGPVVAAAVILPKNYKLEGLDDSKKLTEKKREILYEILLVYFTHFLNPVKKEEEDKSFFVNFFEHIITKKGFSFLNQGLTFISYIDTFITGRM